MLFYHPPSQSPGFADGAPREGPGPPNTETLSAKLSVCSVHPPFSPGAEVDKQAGLSAGSAAWAPFHDHCHT